MKQFLTALFLMLAMVLPAKEIIVHAEDTKNLGQWQIGKYSNATCMIGSAIKAEAIQEFEVAPENAGKYYMFVRTFDHKGGFRWVEVALNNMKLGKFGDNKNGSIGWNWHKCKIRVNLKPGKNKLKMIANSHTSRLDCIVFTSEDKAPETAVQSTKKRQQSGLELEGIFRRPESSGNGPKALVLAGGRPWVGNGFGKFFINSGFYIELLNGVYLDGLSGASIKLTPTDPVEPKALDGITPEFARLDKYELVIVAGIPENFQQKLFTPTRVAQLKKFVKNGGKVMFTINAPDAVKELLPVTLDQTHEDDTFVVRRPDDKIFASLPESWRLYRDFRIATLKKGAKTVIGMYDVDDNLVNPYAAIWNYGKGQVMFVNADSERRQQGSQLLTWAYGGAHWAALAGYLQGGDKIDPAKNIAKEPRKVASTVLDKAVVTVSDPVLELTDCTGDVKINDNEIVFSNGARVVVDTAGNSVDFYLAGAGKPYLKDMLIPEVSYPGKADKVDDTSTAEATAVKSNAVKGKAVWSIAGIRTAGNTAVIDIVSSEGGKLEWIFKAADMEVDGRKFAGIAEAVEVKALPGHLLNSVKVQYLVNNDSKRVRRFACYAPPRGYAEYDATGKENFNTAFIGAFGAGQPFGWVEGEDGVLVEFIGGLTHVTYAYSMKKGDSNVKSECRRVFGRIKVSGDKPAAADFYYHMMTDKKFNGDNDWMAIYQFVRKYLRKVANFPEVAAQPCSGNKDTCTNEDQEKVFKLASENGFRLHYLNRCPSPMESFETEASDNSFRLVKKYGLRGYPWFPCAHSPDKTRTVKEHPEWYYKDENGKLTQYFGHFYVANLENPEFSKWHYGLVDRMIDLGLGCVWYDMGGAYTGMMDFSLPESRTGFYAQQELYRHFYKRGAWVVTEGMNPLVLDGYLLRPESYTDTIGREFAYIGAQPSALNVQGQLHHDTFRMAMYGVFMPTWLECVVLDFDMIPNHRQKVRKLIEYVPVYNQALDNTGMPFVRQTEYGTSWIGEKGGSLFFFNGAKTLEVDLPDDLVPFSMKTPGGKITMLNGKMPLSVPAESVIVLKRK